MHLSMLSESFLSDSLDDSNWRTTYCAGREHRDGVLRGILFFAALGLVTFFLIGAANWDADRAAEPVVEPASEHCAVAAAPSSLEHVRFRSQTLDRLADPASRTPFDAD